ncbi:hypothetical protein [Gaoshiqia sp. Z1-71]|uniref:hypothetical protein n=1 Tax=Gaoshiqia hydrogeniformans TaxID=3290090 RepID=UPI003BF8DE25
MQRRSHIRTTWFRQIDNTIELTGKVNSFNVKDFCAAISIFKTRGLKNLTLDFSIPIDEKFDCYFLTGIMASKLISILYLNSSSIATKDDFRQTTLTELRKLPIPNVNDELQKPISEIVKEVLKLKSENSDADTSKLENQIDQLVYQLYDLTEEEIEIIEYSGK